MKRITRRVLMGLVSAGALDGVARADTVVTRVSAPILPAVLTLYAQEGANFPADLEAQAALVDAAVLPFNDLRTACMAYSDLYAINPLPTTPAEIASDYDEIARCAYEQFTAKPYWIPALVDHVDVCERTLGDAWHLLTAADVAAFSEDELANLQATLAGAGGTSNWGNFYFSLHVYVRAEDGTLARADLTPGVTGPRITPLGIEAASDAWTHHFEGDMALRCVRTDIVENAIAR